MLVTPVPIVSDCKPLQPEKAEYPMLFTESGIVTDCKVLQPENAESAIPTVSLLIFAAVTEESQSTTHLSTYPTPLSFCIKLIQPSKAYSPMLVTESGIFTDVIPV